MKMLTFFVIALAAILLMRSTRAPAQAPQTQPAGLISLLEVDQRGIAGVLGERLGKVITIHGTVVDGNTWNVKSAVDKTYLRVDRVDKRELKPPVHVELVDGRERVKSPAGSVVSLEGYETGGFSGIVHDPRPRPAGTSMAGGGSPAGVAYVFRTYFVIRQQVSNH